MADQQQQRVHPAFVPEVPQRGKGIARPVEPDVVAVEAEERVAVDQRHRPDQPAAGFQQGITLVRDLHLGHRAQTHMCFQLVGR
jgi:hypothetical protein